MPAWLDALLPPRTARRWMATGFMRSPLRFPLALVRSLWGSWQLARRILGVPVRLDPGQQLLVRHGRGAVADMRGVLHVSAWNGGQGRSSITLGPGAKFRLGGNFSIGHGVHLSVAAGGTLEIGGDHERIGSGITCDSRVMVASDVRIGSDVIIAWGCVITDSDWHVLDGRVHVDPVSIGNRVWIAHGCSVLRGSRIPPGCVLAAKSLTAQRFDEPKALLAGVPAKVIRIGVTWER